jgi:hypothetical protein
MAFHLVAKYFLFRFKLLIFILLVPILILYEERTFVEEFGYIKKTSRMYSIFINTLLIGILEWTGMIQKYKLAFFKRIVLFVNSYFMGPKLNSIFKNKRLLFFTSNMKERNILLKKNLIQLGALEVDFYYTSLNNPMLDVVDFDKIKIDPDIVFVAAGVGSSNILVQIKKLNRLSVDCGFMVDALSDINFAKQRIYYCNDENFEKKTWFN